jgi:lantibiotic biosynthesis dehydratase-like protein
MSTPSEHTLSIGEGWSVWRRFNVRGSGFPVALLEPLAAVAAVEQIDAVLDLEAELHQEWRAATAAFAAAAREHELPAAWRSRSRALDKLFAGRDVPTAGLPDALGERVARIRGRVARASELRETIRATLAREQERIAAHVAMVARDDRFREAVTWQNRDLAARLFGAAPKRKDVPLIASYLQRYCAKADNIGFYGPTGWGRFDAGAETAQRAGASLVAKSSVYFEHWAVDTLAQRIAALPGMRAHLAPRRVPTVRLDAAGTAHFADGRSTALDARAVRMLRDCDGVRPARELAAHWREDEEAAMAALADLAARGLVLWTLEVPVGDSYPERGLGRAIDSIGDPELRAAARARLDELDAARARVASAAGDPLALAGALDAANQIFARLTDAAPTRHAGMTYAARTILYQETERDHELVLDPRVLAPIAAPLRLLLWSARWFMHSVVTRFEELFRDILKGQSEMDYVRFWAGVAPHVAGGSAVQTGMRSSLVQEVEAELQRRWAELFGLAPDQRRRELTSAALDERVRATFAAPHAGIALLRHHSPDLSVVADSTAALARGDCMFVLSELHVGGNTFTRPCYFEQCRFADELIAARRIDIPRPELFPILKKDMHLGFSPSTFKDTDLHYETADARSPLPRDRVYSVGELTVREIDGRVLVCSARDGRRFAAAEFLGYYIIRASIQSFSVVPPLPHTPRVAIDRLVVARETWRLPREAFAFLEVSDDAERLIATRKWARGLDLPRLVFVKVAEEKKPFYIDLASPVYIDLMRRLVRKTARTVLVSEMLPVLGDSWLADGDGHRYVCELRMAAVDPVPGPSSI